MREAQRLAEVGVSAAEPLRSQDEWIHRRVESITFPFPNRRVYRRHVSVDFTIPSGLTPAVDEVSGPGATRPPRYYVPLSYVRRWPPMPHLDLRDPGGQPAPFLTARQNALLDSAALQGLALHTSMDVSDALLDNIANIADKDQRAERVAARHDVLKGPSNEVAPHEADAHRALLQDQMFCTTARTLVANTLLWIRVQGWPEDRVIAKFAYDAPMVREGARPSSLSELIGLLFTEWRITEETPPNADQVGPWSPAAFGLVPFSFNFQVPHLGETSSYHCNVVAPPPLSVLRAELGLYDSEGENPNRPRYYVDSTAPRPHGEAVDLYAGIAESQAKFYASGDRTGLRGESRIAVLIQSHGLLLGALGVAAATLAIMLTFTVFLADVAKGVEPAVAVLLISPAVLGYISVRPSEEALAGGFLIGLRRVIVLVGAPPIAAATILALNESSLVIRVSLAALAAIQAGLLWALWRAFQAGLYWRRFYKAHPDATLAP